MVKIFDLLRRRRQPRAGYRKDAFHWESAAAGFPEVIADRANRREAVKDAVKAYLCGLPLEVELRLLREYWQALGTRDMNEPMIVNELRRAGYEVEYNPPGLPDLFACRGDKEFFVEVKFEASRLGAKQRETFKSLGRPVFLACTAQDVHRIVNGEVDPIVHPH